ncbi:glycosyl transferase, UDP-glucuronosyltransferase [Mycobacterium sp. JS623]|uniref:glycosyltransferase n=1 Tax=Mycobacterium sp. JS623 TaxID=212767 RepID=UPI0002A5580B|nr:glycosyltransferase [Mycobacterium sp. JS623]AGB25028.1 glycosyl transferase, UDP-glucuronosyltransferase [Mycobacterium sp. JS623]
MRVLLSTWGSRGDVEPVLALAVRLQELGAKARVCAPPDFAEQSARLGVEMVPAGQSVRALVHGNSGKKPSTPADAPRVAAELVAGHFETVGAAAEGCDVVVATGLMPAGVRSVAEKVGARYVLVAFHSGSFPSPNQRPLSRPGKPFPPGETDNKVLWDIDAERVNALYAEPLNAHRAAIGLPPVDNVRDHVFTDRPWLATDPTLAPWPGSPYLDVVQTGAWILRDERPLPADLERFLDAGEPPVFVSMGSVRAPEDVARVAIEAVRAHGRRVVIGRGWAALALIDDADDCFVVGEVNHQALFGRMAAVVHHGGAGTTTTTALAGAPQVVVPQIADQPYWGERVADLGIGAAHEGSTPTVESLSTALETALAPETRARARDVAGIVRTDGTTVAAKLLME